MREFQRTGCVQWIDPKSSKAVAGPLDFGARKLD